MPAEKEKKSTVRFIVPELLVTAATATVVSEACNAAFEKMSTEFSKRIGDAARTASDAEDQKTAR